MKWIALIMFGLVGASSLSAGLIWAVKRYTLTQHGVMAEGVVVGQRQQVSSSSEGRHLGYNVTRTGYYPVVEFEIEKGAKIRFVGTTGGGGSAILATGTTVNVIYNPAEPTDALIVDFKQAWLGPLVLSVAGAIFLLFGVGGFVVIGKSDRDLEAVGAMMQRDMLALRGDSLRIEAKIHRIEKITAGGSHRYVLVCTGVRPGQRFAEEFRSEHFPFAPDQSFIGRKVHVYLDPSDDSRYLVELGGLLKEIVNIDQAH